MHECESKHRQQMGLSLKAGDSQIKAAIFSLLREFRFIAIDGYSEICA